MVELRLVGDGGEVPVSNAQIVAILEEYLDLAHRGQIHSLGIVGCGDHQVHTSACGQDMVLCGSLDALKHSILESSLEPL